MAQTPYKFHPSTQLYTPTDPPIHPVMHVLQVQQHERNFHLIYHHSHPLDHLPVSPRVSGRILKSPCRLPPLFVAKEHVQLTKTL